MRILFYVDDKKYSLYWYKGKRMKRSPCWTRTFSKFSVQPPQSHIQCVAEGAEDQAFRTNETTRSRAAFDVGVRIRVLKQPWITPRIRKDTTGTPASCSFLPYASPSSRKTSASQVRTQAGGSPLSCSIEACSGDAVISFCRSLSGQYRSQYSFIKLRSKKYPFSN